MTALEPLKALLAQTERERDAAFAETQRLAQALEAAKVQCEQLIGYRRDYEQRFSAQFRKEGGMELLHCYRGFMERLTQAIDQQQRIVEQAGVRADAARMALQQQEIRVASVKKLIERREHELRQGIERREQKQTDEFASRSAWTRQNLLGDGARLA